MYSYESGHCSAFLLHAILAIAALYAPTETLLASGFTERSAAQESFFSKATILYDFRCERSQLRMLQGSLILSSTVFSYSLDKDFRYWHFNAVRLAVKMGLHKRYAKQTVSAWLGRYRLIQLCRDVIYDMDPVTYRLCKRIWWVVYVSDEMYHPLKQNVGHADPCCRQSRDVLLSFMGHLNMRILSSHVCDTPPLAEDEWDDEGVPTEYESVLVPITQQKKLYFLENCKLAVIGEVVFPSSDGADMLTMHHHQRPSV